MPATGSIQLFDAVDPALDSGSYKLLTQAETHDEDRALDIHEHFLEVVGPRLALGPGDVAASHPPPNASGGFGEDLPYVVLGRRTLPWERPGLGSAAPAATPWLALLVLRDPDEGELRTEAPLADVVGAARAERFGAAPTPVTAVTVKAPRTLQQLLPAAAELPLLCHVRRVNLADTVLAGGDDDGWFAIVLGNRIPLGSAEPGTPYLACLVSLEERDDILAGAPQTQSLVVLHAWAFTSTLTGGTFRRLVRDASRGLIGEAPGDTGLTLASGHLPLAQVDRGGTPATVAYRGPLVARPVADPRPETVTARDGAELPDRSLGVARELGRLLGAADGRLLRELTEWRRADHLATARGALHAAVSAALARPPGAPSLAAGAAPAPDALPTVAALGALARVAEAGVPAADPWEVPPAARAARSAAAERAAAPPATTDAAQEEPT